MQSQTYPNKSRYETEGLPNVGNTCFINAIVQILFASHSFGKNLNNLQTSKPMIACLQKIFHFITDLNSIDEKILQMKSFTALLVKHVDDYQEWQEQDALKFFMDIYGLTREAFPPHLFLASYQKLCPNHLSDPSHENHAIYNFSDELFMEATHEICKSCSEALGAIVLKRPYLTKVPQNIMTFGEDFTSELSVHKLKIQKPSFYILCYKEDAFKKGEENLEQCFSVVEYELKARLLYKGNTRTGHYVAVRKRIEVQKKDFYWLGTETKMSENYYKFDDLDVDAIDEAKLTERDKFYMTKITLYERVGTELSMDEFRQLYQLEFAGDQGECTKPNEKVVKNYSLSMKNSKLMNPENVIKMQRRKNCEEVLNLCETLMEVNTKVAQISENQNDFKESVFSACKWLNEVSKSSLIERKEPSEKAPFIIFPTQEISYKNYENENSTQNNNIATSFTQNQINCSLNKISMSYSDISLLKQKPDRQKSSLGNCFRWFSKFSCFKRSFGKEKIHNSSAYHKKQQESMEIQKSKEITLKDIFDTVKRQRFVFFYKTKYYFMSLLTMQNESKRFVSDSSHQIDLDILHEKMLRDTGYIFYSIHYDELPIQRKLSCPNQTTQNWHQFLQGSKIPEYKVNYIPNEQMLKKQLYQNYISCSPKKYSLKSLLTIKNLQSQWSELQEKKLVSMTGMTYYPKEINSLVHKYISNQQNQVEKQSKKKTLAIYEEIISQIAKIYKSQLKISHKKIV